jgi:DnaK suppressor protein
MNRDSVREILEAKRREILSAMGDRSGIVIEKTADEYEGLQQKLEREIAIRNLDRKSRLLRSVQAAINRLADETFGVCSRCEEPIPEKRISVIPWAAYCVPCQEKLDSESSAEIEGDGDPDELAA